MIEYIYWQFGKSDGYGVVSSFYDISTSLN